MIVPDAEELGAFEHESVRIRALTEACQKAGEHEVFEQGVVGDAGGAGFVS